MEHPSRIPQAIRNKVSKVSKASAAISLATEIPTPHLVVIKAEIAMEEMHGPIEAPPRGNNKQLWWTSMSLLEDSTAGTCLNI